MYDAVLHNSRIAQKRSRVLVEIGVRPGECLLLTVLRPVNANDPERLSTILALGQAD